MFCEFQDCICYHPEGHCWKTVMSIGVDPKITSLIEAIYENVECAVIINGQLTEWF